MKYQCIISTENGVGVVQAFFYDITLKNKKNFRKMADVLYDVIKKKETVVKFPSTPTKE